MDINLGSDQAVQPYSGIIYSGTIPSYATFGYIANLASFRLPREFGSAAAGIRLQYWRALLPYTTTARSALKLLLQLRLEGARCKMKMFTSDLVGATREKLGGTRGIGERLSGRCRKTQPLSTCAFRHRMIWGCNRRII